MTSPGWAARLNADDAGENSSAMLEVMEIGSDPRTVPSGATSVKTASAPDGV